MFSKLLLGMSIGFGSIALAAPGASALKPDDFAYGLDIQVPAGGPVYQVILPESVYRGVTREDLLDLRVFNAQGEIVPHGFQRQAVEARSSLVRQAVLMFPIEGTPPQTVTGTSVELREDAAGKVIQVRFSGNKAAAPVSPRAILLDLRQQQHILKSLEFEWTAPAENRVIPVQVEASDDLSSWRPVSAGAVLAKLVYEKETLVQKRVELDSAFRYRFLKVTWKGDFALAFSGVTGEFVSDETVEVARSWTRVAGIEKPQVQGEYVFNSKATLPVDSIKVLLPETNTFFRIKLLSSRAEGGPWIDRYAGSVYRVNMEGNEIISSPIQLGHSISDRYWKLMIEGKESNPGGRMLELELGWVPQQLLFLARGAGPFRLAYGSADVEAADFGFVSLMESLKAARNGESIVPLPAEVTGGQRELGGPSRLAEAPAVKPIPWKQWALWAVLGFAVLLVAAMAWRLYRELSGRQTPGP